MGWPEQPEHAGWSERRSQSRQAEGFHWQEEFGTEFGRAAKLSGAVVVVAGAERGVLPVAALSQLERLMGAAQLLLGAWEWW